jgi:hypothetical protein
VATGHCPARTLTEELRLDLDPALDSTTTLGPADRPKGAQLRHRPPHTYQALAHPDEPGFFTMGAKSYGRASPSSWPPAMSRQARSPPASPAMRNAASRVHLVLLESGACGVRAPTQTPVGAENPVTSCDLHVLV